MTTKSVAICLHNLVLYETVKPLLQKLDQLNIACDICVPDDIAASTDDIRKAWQEMFFSVFDLLQKKNIRVVGQKEAAQKEYDVAFYPYLPYLVTVKASYNFKYMYGLAKPDFTFSASAVLFDLIFSTSTYDQAYFEIYAKTQMVGPIKFCNYRKKAKKIGSKIQVLYLPTYGVHSSIDTYISDLLELSGSEFDISVKLHHGTSFLETQRLKLIKENFAAVYDQKTSLLDLLDLADIVISDSSGAIFDALYARVPVILFETAESNAPEMQISLEKKLIQQGVLPVYNKQHDELANLIHQVITDEQHKIKLDRAMEELFPVSPEEGVESIVDSILHFKEKVSKQYLYTKNKMKAMLGYYDKTIADLSFSVTEGIDKNAELSLKNNEITKALEVESSKLDIIASELQEAKVIATNLQEKNKSIYKKLKMSCRCYLNKKRKLSLIQRQVLELRAENKRLKNILLAKIKRWAFTKVLLVFKLISFIGKSLIQAAKQGFKKIAAFLNRNGMRVLALPASEGALTIMKHMIRVFMLRAIKLFIRKCPLKLKLKLRDYLNDSLSSSLYANNMYTGENSFDSSLLIGDKSIIIFGVIDWRFRYQRPQQLASKFAEQGYNVFYISSEIGVSNEAGFSIEKLDEFYPLYQVKLKTISPVVIYNAPATELVISELQQALVKLFAYVDFSKHVDVILDHPFWYPMACKLPNARIVYDCMDYHEGFSDKEYPFYDVEKQLLKNADLVVSSSLKLAENNEPAAKAHALIRNACEFERFSKEPKDIFRDKAGRKIIGYFGAIAEWFDIELVKKIATAFPNHLVLLVGNDSANVKSQLASFKNIQFTGEVSYQSLPYYAYSFAVAIIPFKVAPLTLATNPVKVYEYLATGRSVVAVDLPELQELGSLVRLASSHEDFIKATAEVLQDSDDFQVEPRREFASQQTWKHRALEFTAALDAAVEPLVSIVVLCYNNLFFTKNCLFGIERYTDYSNYEVIVVDNASTEDGCVDFLKKFCNEKPHYKLILNSENKGFAEGNNDGLRVARGEYVVILNNDTHVTPGWVRTLLPHFRDSQIGLVGVVTNNIGNEAKINIQYNSMAEMIKKSKAYTLAHMGDSFRIKVAAFFCVMIRRAALEKVGLLDKNFGLGFFEDDDYCMRVREAGYEVICAADVFIHHHLSASFNKLGDKRKQELFEKNKAIYEKKWGPWHPHQYK